MVKGDDSSEARIPDCAGRFPDLTERLEEAFTTLNAPTPLTFQAVKDAYEVISMDLPMLDPKDPYFNSTTDLWRPKPIQDQHAHLDLVPLTRRPLEDSLPLLYAQRLEAPLPIANVLGSWNKQLNLNDTLGLRLDQAQIHYRKERPSGVYPDLASDRTGSGRLLKESSGRLPQSKDLKSVVSADRTPSGRLPKGQEAPALLHPETTSLAGYTLTSNFGIGNSRTDLVVPDAPYHIQVRAPDNKLALVIGFWYTRANSLGDGPRDTMVVSQIQQPRNAALPGGPAAQMGIVGLEIAKLVGTSLGLSALQTYSADRHPMFYQYPERKAKMKGEFKGLYDSSAKALGLQGSPSTNYARSLR